LAATEYCVRLLPFADFLQRMSTCYIYIYIQGAVTIK